MSKFEPGDPRINRSGRPKLDPNALPQRKTNRKLREAALMELVRKFRPLQTKAIQAAVKILDDERGTEASKLKAAALIIGTYKDLIKEVYDYRYDLEDAEEINKEEEPKPKFSLKMVNTGE